MGDLTPEETSERDRAARAWYEATRRARANRWGPHAFPGEDLRRLWDILNPFSWTHGGTAEKSRQRWSEGRKGSNNGPPLSQTRPPLQRRLDQPLQARRLPLDRRPRLDHRRQQGRRARDRLGVRPCSLQNEGANPRPQV